MQHKIYGLLCFAVMVKYIFVTAQKTKETHFLSFVLDTINLMQGLLGHNLNMNTLVDGQ